MKRSSAFALAAVLAMLACNNVGKPPGVGLVNLNFDAQRQDGGGITYQEIPSTDFYFPSLITRETKAAPGGGYAAYFTFDGVARDAGFDGQYLTSDATALRSFAACKGNVTVNENITIALLSKAQAAAVPNGGCPPNPTDGGVEALGQPRPTLTSNSSDITRACGYLTDVFVPGPSAGCAGGTATFILDGGLP